jgi:hypothetical protein
MKSVAIASFFLALVLLPRPLCAQVESGPSAGSKVAALKLFTATGDAAGKEIDYAAERSDKPTIYAFVRAATWDRPTARFLRTLDQELDKRSSAARVIAVWLTDDFEQAKEYLPRVQESLKLTQTTFTVYPGDKNGPPGWSINPDAHLTAVVARDAKVIASFGFLSVNETDVPAVLQKLEAKK